MKINIDEKYRRNILGKYDYKNREQFQKDFSEKEQSIWYFVLSLLKQEPDIDVYDSVIDRDYLNIHITQFFRWHNGEKFTVDEFFDYLKDK